VTDDPAIPDTFVRMRAALERTRAVAHQLVGLNLHDANELAVRSGCQLREVKRDGEGGPITADFCTNRINIETEDGIIVGASAG
jgi:hypothetical protein